MMMPFIDRAPTTAPRQRLMPLTLGVGLMATVTALTMVSLQTDANDAQLAERQKLDDQAERARSLAKLHRVPIAGGTAVFTTPVMYRAHMIYKMPAPIATTATVQRPRNHRGLRQPRVFGSVPQRP